MAVENVVCPHCGEMQFANVPAGQRILKVNRSWGHYQPNEGERENDNMCSACKKKFYTITQDV